MPKRRRRLRLEFTKKMAAYAKTGRLAPPRVIFRAGIPNFFETSKHKPHGWLPLYDDMTQKDIVELFRHYKTVRETYLHRHKINVRKHVTNRLDRDRIWSELSKRHCYQAGIPDYITIAKVWARKHRAEVLRMFLRHAWRKPAGLESEPLQRLIADAEKRGFIYESIEKQVVANPKPFSIDEDLQDYVTRQLPKVIRAAVQRYSPSRNTSQPLL